MNIGEVWWTRFPFEDTNELKTRPAIILDVDVLLVLSVRVTKHLPRDNDKHDIPILYWKDAKLKLASTARISKTIPIPKRNFLNKIGELDTEDFDKVKTQYIKYLSESKQNK